MVKPKKKGVWAKVNDLPAVLGLYIGDMGPGEEAEEALNNINVALSGEKK